MIEVLTRVEESIRRVEANGGNVVKVAWRSQGR
jgi:hypothetical protein